MSLPALDRRSPSTSSSYYDTTTKVSTEGSSEEYTSNTSPGEGEEEVGGNEESSFVMIDGDDTTHIAAVVNPKCGQQAPRVVKIVVDKTAITAPEIIPSTTPLSDPLTTPPPIFPHICTLDYGPTQLKVHNSNQTLTAIANQNPNCADCNAERPEWCSINNGIAICIQCSAIHRSLGVNISKIRSLTLDNLPSATESLLKNVGNQLFNSIYEGDPSLMSLLGPKLVPNSTHEQRTQFIRFKYTTHTFVSKEVLSIYSSLPSESVIKSFWAIVNNSLPTLIKLQAAGGCDLNLPFPSPVNICRARDDEIEHIDLSIDVNIILKDSINSNVNKPEDVIIPKGQATTLFHFAIAHGNCLIIEHMFLNTTSFTIKDGAGRTPLAFANYCNNSYAVERLTKK